MCLMHRTQLLLQRVKPWARRTWWWRTVQGHRLCSSISPIRAGWCRAQSIETQLELSFVVEPGLIAFHSAFEMSGQLQLPAWECSMKWLSHSCSVTTNQNFSSCSVPLILPGLFPWAGKRKCHKRASFSDPRECRAMAFWLPPWGPNWGLFWLEAMLLVALSRIRHCLRPAHSILSRSSSSAVRSTAVHDRGCTAGDALHREHGWKEGVNSCSEPAPRLLLGFSVILSMIPHLLLSLSKCCLHPLSTGDWGPAWALHFQI